MVFFDSRARIRSQQTDRAKTEMSETIVFLDAGTLGPDVVMRRPDFPHLWRDYGKTAVKDIVARAQDATILVVNKVPLQASVIEQLPRLKFVAVAATGTDNVDLQACRSRGILVSNVQAYAVHTVPEHTFALILALRRSLLAYRTSVAAGEWQASEQFTLLTHPISDLHGSTLGIIGEGAIGQAVASLGRAFGMRVLFAAHKGSTGMGPLYTPFDEVLVNSDVITLHCPLVASTRNLLSEVEFGRMRRRPLIINTARGGLIDEQALVSAIESGQIAGAAVDAVTPEPPPHDHPLMRLAERHNFILTPHIGWASLEARKEVADQVTASIEGFVSGNPRNLVPSI